MKNLLAAIYLTMSLGNFSAMAGLSDSEIEEFINTFKKHPNWVELRCKPLKEDKARKKTAAQVASGRITQAQADRLNREGVYLVFDEDDGQAVICSHGCFAPNTLITVLVSENNWKEIPAESLESTHLAASPIGGDFEILELIPKQVVKAIISPSEEMEHIITFTLDTGKVLEVTPGHGMLLANGKIERASLIKVGEKFIGINGDEVEIKKIEPKSLKTKVYNFRLSGDQPHDHLMVASQVLVGDHYWQGEGVEDVGAINIRNRAMLK